MNKINLFYKKLIVNYKNHFFLSSKSLFNKKGEKLPKIFQIDNQNLSTLKSIFAAIVQENKEFLQNKEVSSANSLVYITKKVSAKRMRIQFNIRFYNFKIIDGKLLHYPGFYYTFFIFK